MSTIITTTNANIAPDSLGILWAVPTGRTISESPRFMVVPHHHVTLKFRVSYGEIADLIGTEIIVVPGKIAWNDDIEAMAVWLPGVECSNDNPHVTLSHREGIAPFKSNEMLAGLHESRLPINRDPMKYRIEFLCW